MTEPNSGIPVLQGRKDVKYEQTWMANLAAIELGIECASDDSLALQLSELTRQQIEWIAQWLASESIGPQDGSRWQTRVMKPAHGCDQSRCCGDCRRHAMPHIGCILR